MTPLQTQCATAGPRPTPPHAHRHLCLQDRTHTENGEAHRCHACGHEWVSQTEEDRALLSALEEQLNTLRLAGSSVANVNVAVQTGSNFVDNKRRFRITGELVQDDGQPSLVPARPHAWWDDGHQVSIPGNVLAELEAAWRQVTRWSLARQAPDPLHDDPPFLDYFEQNLAEEVVRRAVKAGRALLTNTGPLWSVRPLVYGGYGEHVDFEEAAHGIEWKRGTPLPFAGDPAWLMCRMSGLSIPHLLEERT
jgi:hypothetical protein